ncbi:MAG: hypothetical protein JW795_10725 [Chitinivibrionales bacterium]|nr:hypothetical protein [Chitinivibrionales bacterium]
MSMFSLRSNFIMTIRPSDQPLSSEVEKKGASDIVSAAMVNTQRLRCGPFNVVVNYSANLGFCRDERRGITVFLHGELYNNHTVKSLLTLYAEKGLDFCKTIEGSFIIGLIDEVKQYCAVITDRTNSKKVFYEHDPQTHEHAFFTSIYLSTSPKKLNPATVGMFLANGYLLNGRTVFYNCDTVKRASQCIVTALGVENKRYWDMEFTGEFAGKSVKLLKQEMADILIAAVKKRVQSTSGKVFLSLSGGYDSTAILGILAHLKIPDVQCLSYFHHHVLKDTDEYISQLRSKHVGYSHSLYDTYGGDLDHILRLNGQLSNGMLFSHDPCVWETFVAKNGYNPEHVVFVGDQSFMGNMGYRSEADIRYSLFKSDLSLLQEFKTKIDSNVFKSITEGVEHELTRPFTEYSQKTDLYDKRHYVYLDQELANRYLSWRDFFISHFLTVRNPWIDNDMLDFIRKLPRSVRKVKYLFVQTVRELFPDLFTFPRVMSSSFTSFIDKAFCDNQEWMKTAVLQSKSPLDEIIPPGLIVEMLESLSTFRIVPETELSPLKKAVKTAKLRIMELPLTSHVRSFYIARSEKVGIINILERYFLLRYFLEEFPRL